MRLTVLGSGASYPGAGHACAGYLVEIGEIRVLLDCGNGSVSNLARVCEPERLSAVFITHAHVDHFADLYVLQAALRYAPQGPAPALDLFVAEGVLDSVLAPLSEHGRREMGEAFVTHGLTATTPTHIGDLSVTPVPVTHAANTFALAVDACGARLFYTSDAVLDDALVAAASGANVLLADATLPDGFAGRAPHMTPAQAGALASTVGAGTLILTHLWPSVDREVASREAARFFDRRIIVASELLAIDIPEEE